MHIYFSGILGAGISALANIALDLGFTVSGSDPSFDDSTNLDQNPTAKKLLSRGVNISHLQTSQHIQEVFEKAQKEDPITWFVHTAAVKEGHPELVFARNWADKYNQGLNNNSNSSSDSLVNSGESDPNQKISSQAFQSQNNQTQNLQTQNPTTPDQTQNLQSDVFQDQKFHIGKRDEFVNWLVGYKKLKLVAIAGTHGKTTTTGMMLWLFKSLNIPVSYLVGSEISFGASGQYDPKSQYFVFECDEFDRNFLKFYPETAIIPSLDYDHQDIYPTQSDYYQAFVDFFGQVKSQLITSPQVPIQHFRENYAFDGQNLEITDNFGDLQVLNHIKLPGVHNRQNAELVFFGFVKILAEILEQVLEQDTLNQGDLRRDSLEEDGLRHGFNLSKDLSQSLAEQNNVYTEDYFQKKYSQRQILRATEFLTKTFPNLKNSQTESDFDIKTLVEEIMEAKTETKNLNKLYQKLGLFEIISAFPGTRRRFEKISPNHLLYSDYAHHPSEIRAVIKMAQEILDGDC